MFERKLRNDPFFKDAYEGFKSNPKGLASLSRLELKKKLYNSNNIFLSVVLVFVILFFVSGFLFFSVQNKEKGYMEIALNELDTVVRKADVEQKGRLSSNDYIESSAIKQELKQKVVYTKIVEEEKQKERPNEIVIFNSVNEAKKEEPLVYVEHKKLKKIEINSDLELDTKLIPLVSIHGLINVNYEK